MYVVAGVTGQTGMAVAEALLEQNAPITVIVRDERKGEPWKRRGAEVAVASLDKGDDLAAVLAKADGAYLLDPPKYTAANFLEDRAAIADQIAHAVSKSGIKHVVLLSSVGAQHSAGTGLILTLNHLEKVVIPAAKGITVLRPTAFLENWKTVLPVAKEHGVLPSFFKAGEKIPMVATRDVGRFAANALLEPATDHRMWNITGPQEYTTQDIAEAATSVLKRPVTLQSLPPDAAQEPLTQAGFPLPVVKLFIEMYKAQANRLLEFEPHGTLKRGALTPQDVFAELVS